MQAIANVLVIIANALILVVYLLYLKQIIKSESTPNPATWIIWFVVTLINALTYINVTNSPLEGTIAITACCLMGIIMVYTLIKGKFGPLKTLEWWIIMLAISIGIFWQISANIIVAHLLLQIILVLSFVPTIKGLIKKELKEKAPPWITAALAYSLQIIALLIVYAGNWVSLAYPILNGIIGNGSIAVLAIVINHNLAKEKE